MPSRRHVDNDEEAVPLVGPPAAAPVAGAPSGGPAGAAGAAAGGAAARARRGVLTSRRVWEVCAWALWMCLMWTAWLLVKPLLPRPSHDVSAAARRRAAYAPGGAAAHRRAPVEAHPLLAGLFGVGAGGGGRGGGAGAPPPAHGRAFERASSEAAPTPGGGARAVAAAAGTASAGSAAALGGEATASLARAAAPTARALLLEGRPGPAEAGASAPASADAGAPAAAKAGAPSAAPSGGAGASGARLPPRPADGRVCSSRPPSANGTVARWLDARGLGGGGGLGPAWGRNYTLTNGDPPIQLVVDGCDGLPYIGPAFARRCLAGRHILLMGDSLTRYQYLNLVNMLASGAWDAASGEPAAAENERSWAGGWPAFYAGTAARLRGLEVCDCARPPGDTGPGGVENRYFYDAARRLRVTFVALLSSHPMRHHGLDFLNVTCNGPLAAPRAGAHAPCAQAGCAPGACGLDDAPLRAAPRDVISCAARELAPLAAVIVNSGLWGDFSLYKESVADLLNAADAVLRRERTAERLWWKTTTAPAGPTGYDAPGREYPLLSTLEAAGWGRHDGWALSVGAAAAAAAAGGGAAAHWDLVHLNRAVYRGLNQALLADLCWADVALGPEGEDDGEAPAWG